MYNVRGWRAQELADCGRWWANGRSGRRVDLVDGVDNRGGAPYLPVGFVRSQIDVSGLAGRHLGG
jgi:hypothetical protein